MLFFTRKEPPFHREFARVLEVVFLRKTHTHTHTGGTREINTITMQSPAGLHAASPGNVEILGGKQAGQQVVRPLVLTLPPPREYRIHPFPSSFLQSQDTAMLKQMEWEAEVTGRKADVLQVTAPHPPPNTELDINGLRMSIQDTIRAERKRKEEEKRLKKEHRSHEDAIAPPPI